MTPEQRLDRLERIAKLFVKAGLRARHDGRDQDKKIDHLIDLQIHNEEKFAKHEEKFANQDEKMANLIELHKRNEERFVKLAESQADTDRRLHELIDIIREGRNGNSKGRS
jgi:hypothetical protein